MPKADTQSNKKTKTATKSISRKFDKALKPAERAKSLKRVLKGSRARPNPFKKLVKASTRLNENALAACEPIARGPNETNVIKSLGGELNPGPDFVVSNGPLGEKIAEIASSALAAIALKDPPPLIGILGREVGVTTLDAPEIHIDEIGRLAGRTMSSISSNYLAVATLATLPRVAGPPSIQVGFKGVFWGRRSKGTYEASLTEFSAKSRSSVPMIIEWCDDQSKVVQFFAEALKVPALKKPGAVGRKGQKKRVKGAVLPPSRHLEAFALCSLLDRKRMIFAGGEGKSVKAAIVTMAVAWLKDQRMGPLPVHPDGVLNFWLKVKDQLNEGELNLPLITYRSVPSARRQAAKAVSTGKAESPSLASSPKAVAKRKVVPN